MPRIYDELRQLAIHRIAANKPNCSLSSSDLLHEVYMRLSKEGGGRKWSSEQLFISAAAESMRRILVDRYRAKKATKRGGDFARVDMDTDLLTGSEDDDRILAINNAIDELELKHPESAELVKLRFFVGFTLEEIADSQGVASRTIKRKWAFAKAWILRHLEIYREA